METGTHPLRNLFEQLGLPSSNTKIAEFIAAHAPLDSTVLLAEAGFWSAEQKEFLRDELLMDADWAASIDLLNSQIRQSRSV
jgi:hypothetical protein